MTVLKPLLNSQNSETKKIEILFSLIWISFIKLSMKYNKAGEGGNTNKCHKLRGKMLPRSKVTNTFKVKT